MSDYTKQAEEFAKKHGITLKIGEPKYINNYFDDKDGWRYVFPCTLKRNGKSYSFKFGQSTASGSEKPRMYDILTCMTKYEPGTFENFCSAYGYDEDSRKAEKVYKAVLKEYAGMKRLFSDDILEEMQEIQ